MKLPSRTPAAPRAHVARKRFGQNFLTDQTVLHDIMRVIDPQPDDLMVEIGPGLGAMTAFLLQSVRHLHVVELDRDLVAHLQKRFPAAKLTVHGGDALKFDFASLVTGANADVEPGMGVKNVANPVADPAAHSATHPATHPAVTPRRKLRVVGNLPYNISSPLLFHLAEFTALVEDQHFMLQKEVVERMVAEPGSKTYGRLSVMLQWRYRMDLMFIVPPTAFDPPPKVESAIVRMIPREQPLACDETALARVVQQAFSQRRKVLRNCLAGMFTADELVATGVDPQARAETIALEQYVALANRLTASGL
jgi:16S rRNA (adenine1518-N6/adenine1519-N6)-dimethyltransferase